MFPQVREIFGASSIPGSSTRKTRSGCTNSDLFVFHQLPSRLARLPWPRDGSYGDRRGSWSAAPLRRVPARPIRLLDEAVNVQEAKSCRIAGPESKPLLLPARIPARDPLEPLPAMPSISFWIDHQRRIELVRGAGEFRQHQHAGIGRVLRGDILLGDQILPSCSGVTTPTWAVR